MRKKVTVKKGPKKPVAVSSVTRLYGRCLTLHAGPNAFSVKVMGTRDEAADIREQLIAALVASGIDAPAVEAEDEADSDDE